MQVEGFANPRHVLLSFLAHEYAFSYSVNDKVIQVAHSKGTWFFAKLKEGALQDFFTWADCFTGIESANELTHSFVDSIRQMGAEKESGGERADEARWIMNALDVWAGPTHLATKASVVQPGRNSWIDEKTGEFRLSPRPNEFHT